MLSAMALPTPKMSASASTEAIPKNFFIIPSCGLFKCVSLSGGVLSRKLAKLWAFQNRWNSAEIGSG